MKVGIAGTGRMGSAICRRLLEVGNDVAVWNRTRAKTRPLGIAGARVVESAAELASISDFVITMLTDAVAIEAVYLGEQGLLADTVRGKLFMEMSTVQPATQRALAARVRNKGAAMIDCPGGGTVGPASEGRLFVCVGGAVEDFERAKPLLMQITRRLEHVGPIGAGATIKLAMNLMVQVFWQSCGEAIALCKPLGLTPDQLMNIFVDSSGAPRVLHHRAGDIARAMQGSEIAPVNFDIDSVRKDMRAMLAEAREVGCSLPVLERALECFDVASREGLGAKDCATLPAIWAQRES